jgi:hypothetical protein
MSKAPLEYRVVHTRSSPKKHTCYTTPVMTFTHQNHLLAGVLNTQSNVGLCSFDCDLGFRMDSNHSTCYQFGIINVLPHPSLHWLPSDENHQPPHMQQQGCHYGSYSHPWICFCPKVVPPKVEFQLTYKMPGSNLLEQVSYLYIASLVLHQVGRMLPIHGAVCDTVGCWGSAG